MIGTNTLELCEAEMIVALQEYIDKRMGLFAPCVTSIKSNRDTLNTFRLSLCEKDKAKAKI